MEGKYPYEMAQNRCPFRNLDRSVLLTQVSPLKYFLGETWAGEGRLITLAALLRALEEGTVSCRCPLDWSVQVSMESKLQSWNTLSAAAANESTAAA